MFDIGWSEMGIVLLLALIIIGPKDLPRVARTLGQWVGKARALAREFQRSLDEMAREAELDDVKKQIEKAGSTVNKARGRNLGKLIEDEIDPEGELGDAFNPKSQQKAKSSSGASTTASPKRDLPTPSPQTDKAPDAAADAASDAPVPASADEPAPVRNAAE